MKLELINLYQEMQRIQLRAHELFQSIVQELTSTEIKDLVDSGYFCREIANVCDDVKKAAQSRQAVIAKVICAQAAVASMQDEVLDLKGEYATGVPDLKVKPKLPENGTPEFVQLMRWIGATDEQIATNMLRPSFTGIQEVLTQRAAAGQKPPPGIEVTFTEASVVFRKRNVKKGKNDEQEF